MNRVIPSLFLFMLFPLFFLSSCASAPSGPVSPGVVGSPTTPVVIHPGLDAQIAVPNADQGFSYTDGGHLRYSFRLQNKTNIPVALRYRATFYDESGMTTVDEQGGKRLFLDQYEIRDVPVVCTNTQGRKVRVQVSPAD
jgi:uncharacterized protein YcfL